MPNLLPPRDRTVPRALTQATSLLWIDVLVTLAALATIASRF
jgi:hypothetical protein